jgi:proteic killer suppression protein
MKRLSLAIQQRAVRKLQMLRAAQTLSDLLIPPGNRLEAMKGGQHSIRINEQYRICFLWQESDAFNIEIVDYHR